MTRREVIAKLNDEEYALYIKKREAKRQKKWRRKMKKLKIPVASNLSRLQRIELRKAK